MKIRFAILLFVLLPIMGLQAQQSSTPKAITWKDVPSWKSISPFSVNLSPDGAWFAYVLSPVDGDADLIIQNTRTEEKKTFALGNSNNYSMSFSEDGKWIAFKEYPKNTERKAAAKTPSRQLFDKLHVLELSSGKKTEYEKVNSYAFNGERASHIAIHAAR
ncbi:MAG TPA: S9 family peptidase, partial [Cyclobacteriaceae bacterium]|nr:S9 family peptidase [Cyclobacteriaceae bacterium]